MVFKQKVESYTGIKIMQNGIFPLKLYKNISAKIAHQERKVFLTLNRGGGTSRKYLVKGK